MIISLSVSLSGGEDFSINSVKQAIKNAFPNEGLIFNFVTMSAAVEHAQAFEMPEPEEDPAPMPPAQQDPPEPVEEPAPMPPAVQDPPEAPAPIDFNTLKEKLLALQNAKGTKAVKSAIQKTEPTTMALKNVKPENYTAIYNTAEEMLRSA